VLLAYLSTLVVVHFFFPTVVNAIVLTYCIYSVCCPFIAAVVTTRAMEIFSEMGGTASSAITSIRQLMASFITFSAAAVYNQTFGSITVVLTVYASFIFIAFFTHKRDFEHH
jgi:hypothetical protein